jgi:hypothetical protein
MFVKTEMNWSKLGMPGGFEQLMQQFLPTDCEMRIEESMKGQPALALLDMEVKPVGVGLRLGQTFSISLERPQIIFSEQERLDLRRGFV